MMHRLIALFLATGCVTALARADDPVMPKAATPPLEIVPGAATVTVYPALPFRFGTREVWQYYGVDNSGRWRPVVVRSPYSTSYFYLHNGREYPWTTTRPLDYMPYAD